MRISYVRNHLSIEMRREFPQRKACLAIVLYQHENLGTLTAYNLGILSYLSHAHVLVLVSAVRSGVARIF